MAKRKRDYGGRRGFSREDGALDRPRSGAPAQDSGGRSFGRGRQPESLWLFGTHPVLAALANPERPCRRLLMTAEAERALGPRLAAALEAGGRAGLPREIAPRGEIDHLLAPGSVHQGLALEVEPLPEVALEDICRQATGRARTVLLVLDQVTDPQNVGAVLRAAAAFGAAALIVTERHAPGATATLAKAASGALELVPLVRVTNLARSLEALKEAEFWCIGLDAEGTENLAGAKLAGRAALVLGAEGLGLRRLTRENCDMLLRIPMESHAMASLNVATAAAIALYEWARGGRAGT